MVIAMDFLEAETLKETTFFNVTELLGEVVQRLTFTKNAKKNGKDQKKNTVLG